MPAHRLILCAAVASLRIALVIASAALLYGPIAHALPGAAYQVELISHAGATSTSIRGVDANGRVLGYWSFYSQPLPIGAPPDDSGYFFWENGVETALTIPGLTGMNIHRMNVGGAIWGSSDQGTFVYRDGSVSLLESPLADVTIVRGVDAVGRVYGILGNYPPGVDPNGTLVPIDPVSMFVWEAGAFANLDILLTDGTLHGVLQNGVLWGSNSENAFIQDGASLTVLDHPDFDYTGIHALTADGEVFGLGLNTADESYDSIDFFWDPVDGFQEWPAGENLPGTSERPHTLNEAGVFWGTSAPNTAFVATPIPEPGTAALVTLGLVGLVRCGRRSARARVSRACGADDLR